jgi:hypothetical protein
MRRPSPLLLLVAALACGDASDTTPAAISCEDVWAQLQDAYPDAGELGDCDAAASSLVQRSLLVVDDLTIDNDGAAMSPCVAARCDADYAYIASNNLPHYDFIKTNPNALREAPTLVRVPLAPALPPTDLTADDPDVQTGCIEAYDQHQDAPDQSTTREPSGLCTAAADDPAYLRETLANGDTVTTAKLACLGATAILINGVITAGPNEAQAPDPYGNPVFSMPLTAGEVGDRGMSLDLCGGHSGGSMHYHGVNEACFAQSADGSPTSSYATASQAWDVEQMLQGECTAPSPIVGWSPDGHPIKGPCVCIDADCTTIKRARSSWVYRGLDAWGDNPGEAANLAVENQPCVADDDCCAGADCNYRCAPLLTQSAGADGTEVERRCALLDYAWCTHQYIDRTAHAPAQGFVYLDRCNGHDGPDGYAYHATASFPYIQACYRGQPQALPMLGTGGGAVPMMEGDDGGQAPPTCAAGQTMCCGDDLCDGPETADNCPDDCA